MRNRAILGCLGAIGLAVAGTGTLALLNWGAFREALHTQEVKTEAALFRWGELRSISAALKARYGVEPEVTYDTSTSDRILDIRFGDYRLPEHVTTKGHAREIAAFALGKTTKFEQVDVVRVLFQNPSETYTYAPDDLMPRRPQAASGS